MTTYLLIAAVVFLVIGNVLRWRRVPYPIETPYPTAREMEVDGDWGDEGDHLFI